MTTFYVNIINRNFRFNIYIYVCVFVCVCVCLCVCKKISGKVHPRTGYEDPEYSTLS